MSVRTDTINLQVNINGDEARNKLNELRKSAADIKFEMDGLKKGTEEYKAKAAELNEVKSQMDTLKQSIGITAMTVTDLRQEITKLTSLRNATTPMSEDWKKYDTELKTVIARHKELIHGIEAVKHEQSMMMEVFKGFTIASLLEKAIDGIKEFFKGSLEEANKAQEAADTLKLSLENAGRTDLFEKLTAKALEFHEQFKRIDKDDIKGVFTKLIDYGKLTENQIEKVTEVIINFAAKQHISLGESTDIITKALEGNGRALKTYGINVKDAHTVTERFGIIMDQLGNKVKGAEDAFEETNVGMWETFKATMNNMKEKIGEFIYSLAGLEEKRLDNAVAAKKESEEGNKLVSQYEELSKKTNKTTADKKELEDITVKLGSAFGSSVTYIDKETGALKLNLEATKDLIKQKILLANNEASSLALKYNQLKEEREKLLDEHQKDKEIYEKRLATTGKSDEYIGKIVNDRINVEGDSKERNNPENVELANLKMKVDVAPIKRLDNEMKDVEEKLNKLGFDKDNVDKLFNPGDPNKPVGNSDDPNIDKNAEAKAKAAAKKAEEEHKKLLEEAAKFNEQLGALRQKNYEDGLPINQKEILDVKIKFDELIAKAKEYYKKGVTDERLFLEQNKQLKEQYNLEMDRLFNQQFTKNSGEEYKDSLALAEKYYEEEKKKVQDSFLKKEITEKQFDDKIKSLEKMALGNKIQNAKDYSATVKTAAKDLQDLTIKQTSIEVDESKKRIKLTEDEEMAKLNIQVLITKKGTDARLNAEKKLIEAKFALEVKNIKDKYDIENDALLKTNQLYILAEKKKNDAIDDLEKNANHERIQQLMQYIQDAGKAFKGLNQIINNIENNELQKDKTTNDTKKKNYKTQLDNKLISKNKYDLLIQQSDDEYDKADKKTKYDQAQRQKILSEFNVIVNTAEAVMKAVAQFPLTGGEPATTIAYVMGAIELGAIASAPLPEHGEGNWVRSGDKHTASSRGIPTLIERDEAVMNAKTMTDEKAYEVSGTPAQITSSLNGLNGKQWSMGATMKILQPSTGISSKMPMIMAMGGIPYATNTRANIPFTSTVSSNSMGDTTAQALLQQLITSHEEQKQQMQNWQSQLHVRYTPVDTRERRKIDNFYDASQQQSSLK